MGFLKSANRNTTIHKKYIPSFKMIRFKRKINRKNLIFCIFSNRKTHHSDKTIVIGIPELEKDLIISGKMNQNLISKEKCLTPNEQNQSENRMYILTNKSIETTQIKLFPYPNYIKLIQTDINEAMREILINWLMEVHFNLCSQEETLYLAINILDRYLGVKNVTTYDLQTVGIASLMIAIKYQETKFVEIAELIYLTDNSTTLEHLLNTEVQILKALEYNFTVPSVLNYLDCYNNILQLNLEELKCVEYLIQMCCCDYKMIKYMPSLICSGCLYIVVSKIHNKSNLVLEISGYSIESFELFWKDFAVLYLKFYSDENVLPIKFLKYKFSLESNLSVSSMDIIDKFSSI